jgi:hypothetical protein
MKKITKAGLLILLAAISGILYRLGGWIETKFRDLGCAFIALCSYFLFGLYGQSVLVNIIVYLACFGAMFGALTTYWKKKGQPALWWNWALTGLFYGIASFPLMFVGVNWWAVLVRSLVLSAMTVAVSELSDNVWVEEISRGALIILTVPLLTI